MLTLLLLAQAFVHSPTSAYTFVRIEGHPVYESPAARADPELLARVEARLGAELRKIHGFLPPQARERLKDLPFWIEHDNPATPGMTYHPSAQWLREHGYNPDKARGVEIGNLRNFLDWLRDQPLMVFHEMSHAYHDQVLGFDDRLINYAFENAVKSHAYDSVAHVRGGRQRAYALTNAKEYFAELSEAYWGRNDFYPFTRAELAQFDPYGYEVVEKAWR